MSAQEQEQVTVTKTVKQKRTTDTEWITAFQQSSSRAEAAQKLGLSVSSIIQREKRLRELGVNLKVMESKRAKSFSVAEANKLIAELAEADQ